MSTRASCPRPPTSSALFYTAASRDGQAFSPLLNQVFAIGDGRTSLGQQEIFLVAAGAVTV